MTRVTTTGRGWWRGGALAIAAVLALAGCGGGADDGSSAEEPAATASDDEAAADPTQGTSDEAPADEGSEDVADDGSMEEMSEDEHGDMDMAVAEGVGGPAGASEATRTIDVTVSNELVFDPDAFEVEAGEVVTFVVTNTGDIEHEFVLGDEAMQQEMAAQMASGDDHAHSGESSNAVTVHGGETAELTWRFGEPGTVLVGCHEPGHYEAGMRAVVTVTG